MIQRLVVLEIYRSLVLLGADSLLLGVVGSWGDSLPESEVMDGIRCWNEERLELLKQRIGHYEITNKKEKK